MATGVWENPLKQKAITTPTKGTYCSNIDYAYGTQIGNFVHVVAMIVMTSNATTQYETYQVLKGLPKPVFTGSSGAVMWDGSSELGFAEIQGGGTINVLTRGQNVAGRRGILFCHYFTREPV